VAISQGYLFSSAPYAELADRRLVFLPLYYACSATRLLPRRDPEASGG
jgi:hypothetical protein